MANSDDPSSFQHLQTKLLLSESCLETIETLILPELLTTIFFEIFSHLQVMSEGKPVALQYKESGDFSITVSLFARNGCVFFIKKISTFGMSIIR